MKKLNPELLFPASGHVLLFLSGQHRELRNGWYIILLLRTKSVALGKLLDSPQLEFLHLYNGDNNTSSYRVVVKVKRYGKHLEQ